MSGESKPSKPPKPLKPPKPKKEETPPLDEEPAIIDEVDEKISNENPGLEADIQKPVVAKAPDEESTDGWEEFNPTCKECDTIITGKRADKCKECGVIMHPHCYYQHYMRHHLPQPIALTINVKGSLNPDGTYGNYKGYIKNK